MGKMDEIIIVAPRTKVFSGESRTFQGVLKNQFVIDQIIGSIGSSFEIMRRGDAEENENFKQPIPYAVIKRGDEIFVYERLKGAGETRLHNKLSLGVGGHMNDVPNANSFNELLMDNLAREIEEELKVFSTIKPKLEVVGLINDDEDEVGRVHIGVLVVIEVHKDTKVEVRETEELDGKFISLEQLREKETYERLENWSKIVVDIL